MGNMYFDSVAQWGVIAGCLFDCLYCRFSFQFQMKRQRQNCTKCYEYVPHFHKERLKPKHIKRLPRTMGDQFIWIGSSSDISFFDSEIDETFEEAAKMPERQFFVQSKAPICFKRWDFPKNVWKGITLETNRDEEYDLISRAPKPSQRFKDAKDVGIDRLTIEPIRPFDRYDFVGWIEELKPPIIYVGYETKGCFKKYNINEPSLAETKALVKELEGKGFTVKLKLMREKHRPIAKLTRFINLRA